MNPSSQSTVFDNRSYESITPNGKDPSPALNKLGFIRFEFEILPHYLIETNFTPLLEQHESNFYDRLFIFLNAKARIVWVHQTIYSQSLCARRKEKYTV
jgi:hypothetical protein